MRKTFKLLVFLTVLTIAIWGISRPAFPCDKEIPEGFRFKEFPVGKEYVDLEMTIVEVTTVGVARGSFWMWDDYWNLDGHWVDGEGSFELRGVGFVVSGNYVITAAHCIHPEYIKIALNRTYSVLVRPYQILESVIRVGGDDNGVAGRVICLDLEYDVAVLRVTHDNVFIPLDYPVVNTQGSTDGGHYDLLCPGNAVAMICRQRLESGDWSPWFEVRYGKIESNKPRSKIGLNVSWLTPLDIALDLEIYEGDSGSPLFAFHQGKPIIVGIVRAFERGGYRYAVRIDSIVAVIKGDQHPWNL